MIRTLLHIAAALRNSWLFETAGAGLVIAGCAVAWGLAAALIAGGVAALLKSYELAP